jgi:hypothetical protein
MSNDP